MNTIKTLPEALDPLPCCNRWGEMTLGDNLAKIGDVAAQAELAIANVLAEYDTGVEYFSSPSGRYGGKFHPMESWESIFKAEGFRWLAIFAVEGGNEGHYIHVNALYNDAEGTDSHNLFLVKHLGGAEEACFIASLLTQLLHA